MTRRQPGDRRRGDRRTSIAAVRPQLRQPGAALGPRAGQTIAKILDSTRQIFLTRGYAGTTVDEIMKAAGVSRASFYTYFPSKRDVLLVLGGESLRAARLVIEELEDVPAHWSVGDLEKWAAAFFEMLDEHGSFSFAWTQAAQEDEEIRRAGMVSHLRLCERMGTALVGLGLAPAEDPTEVGLVVFAMLERAWAYSQLYQGTTDTASVVRTIARMLTRADASP